MPESDTRLLEKFVRTNDALAFDQLARRYRQMVFSTARRVTGNFHDAEDVAQNCFIELARRAQTMRTSVAAYLHTMATRRAIDLLRERARQHKHEHNAAAERAEESRGDTPIDRPWEELSPEIDAAIDRLSEKYRVPVILFYLRGLTDADIASELGMTKGTVIRRLQVGVRQLRADLTRGKSSVSIGILAAGLKSSSLIAVPASLTADTGRMALAAGLGRPATTACRLIPASMAALFGGMAWPLQWGLALTCAGFISTLFVFHHSKPVLTPYDTLSAFYSPYLPREDYSGFGWHSSSMRSDLSAYWRGSQPLFFEWCKTHCRDWLDDSNAYVLCQASPNIEDMQRLPNEANPDESARLPFQIELLQGLITLRMAADRDDLISTPNAESGEYAAEIAGTLCRTYKANLLQLPIHLPATGDPLNARPENSSQAQRYLDSHGGFRSLVWERNDRPVQFLRPASLSPAQATFCLAEAVKNNAALGEFLGSSHPTVASVRARVRYDAVTTQGQSAYVILLAPTSRAPGMILEAEQEIPSSAELAGAISKDSRPPAQRAAEDAAILSSGVCQAIGWFQWQGESFIVQPLRTQPPVYERRKDEWLDSLAEARSWAIAAAASHRSQASRTGIYPKITPALELELARRCDAYMKLMRSDYLAFQKDERVAQDRLHENNLLSTWLSEPASGSW